MTAYQAMANATSASQTRFAFRKFSTHVLSTRKHQQGRAILPTVCVLPGITVFRLGMTAHRVRPAHTARATRCCARALHTVCRVRLPRRCQRVSVWPGTLAQERPGVRRVARASTSQPRALAFAKCVTVARTRTPAPRSHARSVPRTRRQPSDPGTPLPV